MIAAARPSARIPRLGGQLFLLFCWVAYLAVPGVTHAQRLPAETRLGVDVLKLPATLARSDTRLLLTAGRSVGRRWFLAGEAGYLALHKEGLRVGSEPFLGPSTNPSLDYRVAGAVFKAGIDWHDAADVLPWTAHTFVGVRWAGTWFSDRGRWHDPERPLAGRTHRAGWAEVRAGTGFTLWPRWQVQIMPALRLMPGFRQPAQEAPVQNVPGFGSLKYNFPRFGKVDNGWKAVPALQLVLLYRWSAHQRLLHIAP